MSAACSEASCSREAIARALCRPHYRQLRDAGGVPPIRTLAEAQPVILGDIAHVPLTRGLVAVIDASDAPRIGRFRWSASRGHGSDSWYASGRRDVLMHRFLLDAPAGIDVDHANHDTLDNRRANLRLATRLDNNRNAGRVRRDNASGYIGVGFHPQTGRWRARVSTGEYRLSLGLFDDPADAARARDAWIRANAPSPFWTFNFPMPGEPGITRERTPA